MINKLLNSNQKYSKYFKNTAWLLVEKGLRVIDAFFIGIWVARYLGPEQFGVLSYAQSFVFLFTALAALGLDQIVIKELVKNKSNKDVLLGTTLGLRLIGFFIMFSLLLITLNIMDNSKIINTMVLIIGVSIFFQSFNGIDFFFQSKVLSKYVVFTNSIVVAISAILKITLVLTGSDLIYFAYVLIVETFLTAIGFIYFYRRNSYSIRKWRFSLSTAVGLLKKSWPLIIGSIAIVLYMKIDQIMIKEIIDEKAVGIYAVAVKLTSIWLFVTVAITQTVFPKLVEIRKNNRALFLTKLQLLYNLLIKIAIVVSILYTLFAKYFVTMLFGMEYYESIPIVIIYIWSIVFVFFNNASWSYYINENLEKFASFRLVIGATINIILNVYFIEYFGLTGAAYATLISYSISGYFINALFNKTRDNFILQTKSLVNIFNLETWRKPL